MQIQKNDGIRRVILLGDSFTFGWGVSEESSFAGILATQFENDNVEIINAGYHAGYAPDAYYAYVQREGLTLKPDGIVVVVYSGNDLDDMKQSFWTKVDPFGGPLSLRTSRRYSGLDGLVFNNLTPCEMVYSLSWSYLATLTCMSILPAPQTASQALYDTSQPTEKKFSAVLKAFAHLSNMVPVTYVLLPPLSFYSNQAADPDNRHVEVAKLLQKEGSIRLLDLTPQLNATYYYQQDRHLTAKGHSAIASHVAPLIMTELGISKSRIADHREPASP